MTDLRILKFLKIDFSRYYSDSISLSLLRLLLEIGIIKLSLPTTAAIPLPEVSPWLRLKYHTIYIYMACIYSVQAFRPEQPRKFLP